MLLLLVTLGIVTRVFTLPLSFGVSLVFSSLFLLTIVWLYGLLPGAAAAVAVNIIACLFLGFQIPVLLSSLEIIFIGVCLQFKQRYMILWDMLYWLIIGIPATILTYFLFQHSFGTEGYLVVLKDVVNGLINALAADIVVLYLPLRRWLINEKSWTIHINYMLSHLLIAAIIGPFLLFMILDGWQSYSKLNQEIIQITEARSFNITEQLKTWSDKDLRALRLRSIIQSSKLRELIDKNSSDGLLEIFVVDQQNRVYITNTTNKFKNSTVNWQEGGKVTLLSQSVYEWLPDNAKFAYETTRWSQAFYMQETQLGDVYLKLLIKTPLSHYKDGIWNSYLDKFFIMLLFCIAAILASTLISRFLIRDLSNLAQSTTDLPDKLKRQELIEWPSSSISEIRSLVFNFRSMSTNLVQVFNDAKKLNTKLLEQTSELEKSEEKFQYLAYIDDLTDLPNRLHFTNHLKGLLEHDNSSRTLAVMLIDIDRFKQINDALGHAVGNLLLEEVAKRIRKFLYDGNFVARLGGDEFVVILSETSREKIILAANYINDTLSEVMLLEEDGHMHELYISASIGISIYPLDAQDQPGLVKNADIAMYDAKEMGGNTYRFYSELLAKNISEQMTLEQNMRRVLERNELLLYYQPKLNIRTGMITGMEALLRWNHPQIGLIPPAKFIPLAEETGMIIPIGEWVLMEACKQNKAWQDEGYPKMRVSVNLSVRQFHGQDLVRVVQKVLKKTKLDPEYLELEITEGFVIKNADYAIQILQKLRNLGVYISIDDFGKGYSSLNRLKYIPIYCLKLDRTFIHNISNDRYNTSIVKAVIQLAHSMDLKVVAEGVEKDKDLVILDGFECDEMQGALFSMPVAKEEFEKMIHSNLFQKRIKV